MVASVVKEEPLGAAEVMNILDETRQVIIYSRELEKATAELKAANERLKELDKLKDEFISTVTHELRTPLTSVRALAEILHDNPDIDPDQHKQFSGIIIKESTRLSRLINDVLDFQKIESGRIDWHIARIDLKKVIKDAVISVNWLILDKNIQLELNLPEQAPLIAGDPDRLIQVLVNLISNAVKFCDRDHGRISISLNVEADYLRTDVKDNGIGISHENQKIVFEKFQQVKDTSRGRPVGTGVGLTITRRIIDFHRGTIQVRSELGKGSVFSFRLPLADFSDLDDNGGFNSLEK
jgi:signal transduction histidine kinase